MTEFQGCFLIGAFFTLIASQYQESRWVCLAYNFLGIIWFIDGVLQLTLGMLK